MSLNAVRGVYSIGAADAVTKAYIRKNEVFADAFNYFMYDGEQEIQPEQLRELDTTEIAILLNEKDTKETKNSKSASGTKNVQKYRDLLKSAAFIRGNPRMNMEVEAARVLETIARMGIEREEVDSMGNVNMCKAIEDMIQDVVDEKKDDWLSEGRIQLLSTLIQSGDISLQKAAAIMNMTPEEFLAKSKTVS